MSDRGRNIFMSIVGVATLLVAVVGATFAYFSITVSGNNTASSINITAATAAAVTFDGTGAKIAATNIYPGWTQTKTFTVKTTGASNTNDTIQYTIVLKSTTITLNTAATNSKEFNYSLSGTKTGSGTVATTVTKADMPKSTGNTTIGTGTLKGNETHTYTLTLEVQERGSAQNYLQGKSYAGIIQINVADSQGLRTWDTATSTWKAYTP